MDTTRIGTPLLPDDVQTPTSAHLTRAQGNFTPRTVTPGRISIRPAVTPLQMAGFDPVPDGPSVPTSQCITSHQVKNVGTFSGRDKQGPKIEDWVRDMRYILELKGPLPPSVQFHEVVRHTGGRARDLVLNLECQSGEVPTAELAFSELLEEYGELDLTVSPMAAFYSRVQLPSETPSDYAIALEALLRRVQQHQGHTSQDQVQSNREGTLTTQFMFGLRDRAVKERLAPMKPREMRFRDLRRELHIINEERRQVRDTGRAQAYEQVEVKPPSKKQPQSDRSSQEMMDLRTQIAQLQLAQQQQLEFMQRLMEDQTHINQSNLNFFP